METADINVSEQSAAEQNNLVLAALEEHNTTGVHDGKISLSGFSLNVAEDETQLSCVQMDARSRVLKAQYLEHDSWLQNKNKSE